MKTAIRLLLLAALTLTVSLNAKSQTRSELKPPSWVGESAGSTKEGASEKLMNEYSDIISKYGDTGEQWWIKFEKNVSATDRTRLEQIFKQMNVDQQSTQKVAFVKHQQPLKKVVPSDQTFNRLKNENVFGIWVDGKKIKNSVLNNYSSNDFEQVTISKLYGAAKLNKNYFYQVDLMTKEYYRKYYKQAIAKTGYRLVFRS